MEFEHLKTLKHDLLGVVKFYLGQQGGKIFYFIASGYEYYGFFSSLSGHKRNQEGNLLGVIHQCIKLTQSFRDLELLFAQPI